MIQIERFRHIAIVVSDLEPMLQFYTQILGFQIKRQFDIQSEDFRKGIGIANAKARGVHLSVPGGVEIELFQFLEPRSDPIISPASPNRQGFRHIALVVSDLQKSYYDLVAKGVNFFSAPVVVKEPKEVAGFQFVYLRDPEGNIIELNQLPKGA